MTGGDSEIRFESQPTGEPGKVAMTVKSGDAIVFQGTLEVTDPEARDIFIKQLLAVLPGVDRAEIEAELLKLADIVSRRRSAPAREIPPRDRPARAWLPQIGERVHTKDRGYDNVGTVLEVDEEGDRARVRWVSKDRSTWADWVDLDDVSPLRPVSVPARLRGESVAGSGFMRGRTGASGRVLAPEWRPFPIESLPDLIRRFTFEQARAIGVDCAYIVCPLLVTLNAAIGNSRRLRIKRDWVVPAVLWLLLVVESSGLKSPCMRAVMQWHRNEEERLARVYKDALREFLRKKPQFDIALRNWKESAKKATDKKPDGLPPIPDESPKRERRVSEDTTTEALAPILDASPRGLLNFRDEAAGFFDSVNEYKRKGGDAARWNSMYDAGAISVDRKGGEVPSIYVPRAAVSILGAIQPGVLARRMTDDARESGLLPRFLLVSPPRAVKRWTDHEVDHNLLNEVEALFRALFALEMERGIDGRPDPKDLSFTSDATDAWRCFVDEHGIQGASLAGDDAAWWGKLEGVAARLALVLAVASDPRAERVDLTAVQAGITIARWFADEIDRVRLLLLQTAEQEEERALLQLINYQGGSITARDLARSTRRFKGSRAAEAALDALVDAGHGRWNEVPPGQKGGRPTRIFVRTMHPVDETTKPSDEDEVGDGADASSNGQPLCETAPPADVPSTTSEVSSTGAAETPTSTPPEVSDPRDDEGIAWEDDDDASEEGEEHDGDDDGVAAGGTP